MNITSLLATILLCLVVYSTAREMIVSRKKEKRDLKRKNRRKCFAGFDFPQKIESVSRLFFAVFLFYLYVAYFPIVFALLSIPGLIIYVLVLFLAIATTWKVVSSSEREQLEPLETKSLVFLGLILSFVGLARSTKFDAIYLDSTASALHIAMLALEYSAYLFFIFALAFLIISDCCRLLIWSSSKLSIKFYAIRDYVRKKASPRTRKCRASTTLVAFFKTNRRWMKWLLILPILVTLVWDMLVYWFQYICIIVLWFPLFCMLELLRQTLGFVLSLARWLRAFSERRITVITFRLSIAVAMFLVVAMNRFGYIRTTDATTSVVEFIASVLIIPIVLGWIQVALPDNKKVELSPCSNCVFDKDAD